MYPTATLPCGLHNAPWVHNPRQFVCCFGQCPLAVLCAVVRSRSSSVQLPFVTSESDSDIGSNPGSNSVSMSGIFDSGNSDSGNSDHSYSGNGDSGIDSDPKRKPQLAVRGPQSLGLAVRKLLCSERRGRCRACKDSYNDSHIGDLVSVGFVAPRQLLLSGCARSVPLPTVPMSLSFFVDAFPERTLIDQ